MAKRKPNLVCQHLERISAAALEKYQKVIREYIRGRHGVYALYKREKLYYVGLATNLNARLSHHLKDRHRGSWDHFSVYLTIETHHIKELESMVLRIAKPKGNSQSGKFPRSQDLKKLFKREVLQLQREELAILMGKTPTPRSKREKTLRRNRKPETTLAPYVNRRLKLRREYKGKLYRASVRQNGWIYYRGHLYSSPSLLASEICNHPANGWSFWQYEHAPDYWVKLSRLRRNR